MRLSVWRRLGALIFVGLLTFVTAGISGIVLEKSVVTTSAGGHAPTQSAVHAHLAAASSPCGFGGNGGGLPLPKQYLVNGSTDQGVDYGAPPDTPECAMGDGVVVGNGINGFGPWAPIVQINDGPLAGRFVYYGHAGPDGLVQGVANVANGQEVSSIGAGIVGISTGPHLEVGFWCPLPGQDPAVGSPCGDGVDMLDYINGALGASNCSFVAADQVCGAIRDKYNALGGSNVLGNPITNESSTPDGIGRYNYFSNDWAIYWTPNTGAWSVHGAILNHWAAMGWERSVVGYPMTDETGTPDGVGRFNHFANDGSIYWTPNTQAHEVHGAIRAKWSAMGWERGVLGYPVMDESVTPNKVGRFNYFSGHGAIYWTGPTGANSIHGAILDKWGAMGWENSVLGFPATDEGGTPDGVGRFNQFSLAGSIYWTPATGAAEIHGAIRDKWASLGWERSFLGYPVTDETGTPDQTGRFNAFSSTDNLNNNNGSIYWTPATAAHEVHGLIRVKWASLNWERGCLGYPITDEIVIAGGRASSFQQGTITFNATSLQTKSTCSG
jgi:uncharacterized protein with LGFP repeats